jgi:hypothetical protein
LQILRRRHVINVRLKSLTMDAFSKPPTETVQRGKMSGLNR